MNDFVVCNYPFQKILNALLGHSYVMLFYFFVILRLVMNYCNCLTAFFFQDNLGKPAPERQNYSGLMKQEMMGWHWHQLDHMQTICTSLQTDNHGSTLSINFCMGWMLFLMPNQQCQNMRQFMKSCIK